MVFHPRPPFNAVLPAIRRCRFMTLLVNFVSMSVHLRSAKEGPSTMRRTCICRGNEQQSLLLPRVSCSCSSHAEDEYAASRAAKAGSCLVPALVSLSVQIFPTESFIAHTADLSALLVVVMVSAFNIQSALSRPSPIYRPSVDVMMS